MDVVTLGIFGGTFDPVHNGHLAVAEAVQSALALDCVLFVPVADPPHKRNRALTPAEDRWRMVKLAVANRPGFAVSRVDIDRAGPQYSVDTVQLLQREFSVGAGETFFIIGADALAGIPHWHNPQTLVERCRLVAVHRPGVKPSIDALLAALPQLRSRLLWVEMPPVPISATEIRRRVARGEAISRLVPAAVADYIARHRLYLSS